MSKKDCKPTSSSYDRAVTEWNVSKRNIYHNSLIICEVYKLQFFQFPEGDSLLLIFENNNVFPVVIF